MIVKNEEEFLEQCLNSVKELVNEIIIVDTGSTDKTIEIAKMFNAKIFKYEWNNDFSEARNFSIKQATKEWILFIDADEIISHEDHAKIKELTENKEVMGYFLIQRNYINDSTTLGWVPSKDDNYKEKKDFTGYLPNPIIRLFQNNKGIQFKNKVHESIGESIYKMNGKVKNSNIPIHHYGKANLEKMKEKGEMYTQIGEDKIEENADEAKWHFELGVQHQELNQLDKASHYFKNAIEKNPKYVKAYINLGGNLIKQNKLTDAFKILKTALKISPNSAEAYNNIGIILAKGGKIEKSTLLFQKAIELNPNYASAYKNLGLSYNTLGKFDEAESALRKAVELNPAYKSTIKFN